MSEKNTLGWGITTDKGVEIWDDNPLFLSSSVSLKEKCLLIFYPKKFVLYLTIKKYYRKWKKDNTGKVFRVLDVGCGTGSAVIDLKRYLGENTFVVGIDVVSLQIELAQKKAKDLDVELRTYDGLHIPYLENYFDVVYSSDVLGHVEHVPEWLNEINRVLKDDGLLAMFSESKLGRHAFVRKYLLSHGLNTDPHKQFHISLYSKDELKKMFADRDFIIERMYSTVWAKMMVHPDELAPALQSQKKFPLLRLVNRFFLYIKKRFHPLSSAFLELYSLIEMYMIGKWVESQGYIIIAKKGKKEFSP